MCGRVCVCFCLCVCLACRISSISPYNVVQAFGLVACEPTIFFPLFYLTPILRRRYRISVLSIMRFRALGILQTCGEKSMGMFWTPPSRPQPKAFWSTNCPQSSKAHTGTTNSTKTPPLLTPAYKACRPPVQLSAEDSMHTAVIAQRGDYAGEEVLAPSDAQYGEKKQFRIHNPT